MKIIYYDEYMEPLFQGNAVVFPNVGDSVMLEANEWFVQSRTFHPGSDTVTIVVMENAAADKTVEAKDGRLSEMKSAILELRRRQDKHESKGRLLREQLVSIRSFLRTKPKTP